MSWTGRVLDVGELLAAAAAEPAPAVQVDPQWMPRHTAAGNAAACAGMVGDEGAAAREGWRFGILQTLDDYTTAKAHGGVRAAALVFAEEPAATGSPALDVAFTALAEHLAVRDGWSPPRWAPALGEVPDGLWFPSVPALDRAQARRGSPAAFALRGIFITDRSLARA